MGEVEAKVGKVIRSDLRHDRHTVSLLTDHLDFSPKYRGKVLEGKVAEAAEEIIKTGYITLRGMSIRSYLSSQKFIGGND